MHTFSRADILAVSTCGGILGQDTKPQIAPDDVPSVCVWMVIAHDEQVAPCVVASASSV